MSQSYQIPLEKEKDNKTSLQARRSDSVSVTMVSATPPNSAAKPIQQLPASTLSHLENIFEAVKKQVCKDYSKEEIAFLCSHVRI